MFLLCALFEHDLTVKNYLDTSGKHLHKYY